MKKTNQATSNVTTSDHGTEETDGRRARSERSREKIVEAVLSLVQRGEIQPGAQRVADVAQVSLRTVYRHFEDMESLYKEIASACEARFMPIITRPYEAANWKARLREQLDRRVQVFEDTMYLRLSTNARRFQSAVLTKEHERNIRLERGGVEALIPDQHRSNAGLVAALDIILCFETYYRLRLETGHAPAVARDVLSRMLELTLRDVPD